MSFLLSQRVNGGHDALGEVISTLAVGAEGLSSPRGEAMQFALGRIIRGLDGEDEGEGSERVGVFEDVGARAADACKTELDASREMPLEDGPECRDEVLEVCARQHPRIGHANL